MTTLFLLSSLHRLIGVALSTAFTVLATSAEAAEIGCDYAYEGNPIPLANERWPSGSLPTTGKCADAFLVGPIAKGDYEKVRALFANNHPFLDSFTITSPGGDVQEAIKIGSLFRKYLISVGAPVGNSQIGFAVPFLHLKHRCSEGLETGKRVFHLDCSCASACALIWFGAVRRSGVVGLHRPQITSPEFRTLPADKAAEVYSHALRDVVGYLEQMETPRPMIDAMVGTSSASVRWVKADYELQRAPSFAEWVDASCKPLSAEERRTMKIIGSKIDILKSKSALPENERTLWDRLVATEIEHHDCELILRDSNREKLPKP
jgi:hypothetical protein